MQSRIEDPTRRHEAPSAWIISLDIGLWQLIDGKFTCCSVAVTTPHFITNREMNPRLTPEAIAAMEPEILQWDYERLLEV